MGSTKVVLSDVKGRGVHVSLCFLGTLHHDPQVQIGVILSKPMELFQVYMILEENLPYEL